MTLNKTLLAQWIRQGFAYNASDGAWAWTPQAKAKFGDYIRHLARNLLYGMEIASYERRALTRDAIELLPTEWFKIED